MQLPETAHSKLVQAFWMAEETYEILCRLGVSLSTGMSTQPVMLPLIVSVPRLQRQHTSIICKLRYPSVCKALHTGEPPQIPQRPRLQKNSRAFKPPAHTERMLCGPCSDSKPDSPTFENLRKATTSLRQRPGASLSPQPPTPGKSSTDTLCALQSPGVAAHPLLQGFGTRLVRMTQRSRQIGKGCRIRASRVLVTAEAVATT